KRDELLLLINSHHPILTIETPEEERAEQLILEVATQLGVPFFTWSVTTGLARFHGAPIYSSETPDAALSNIAVVQGDGIFLLKDFSRYCENDKVCRRLRELAEQFRTARRSIIITAGSIQLPAALARMARQAKKRPHARRPEIRPGPAQRNFDHRRAGLRKKPGRQIHRWRMAIRIGAPRCWSALR